MQKLNRIGRFVIINRDAPILWLSTCRYRDTDTICMYMNKTILFNLCLCCSETLFKKSTQMNVVQMTKKNVIL